jgi:hypothetical protein
MLRRILSEVVIEEVARATTGTESRIQSLQVTWEFEYKELEGLF